MICMRGYDHHAFIKLSHTIRMRMHFSIRTHILHMLYGDLPAIIRNPRLLWHSPSDIL